jgi:ubiquinone/menaquinone biosynthesis C-methylase UbiE
MASDTELERYERENLLQPEAEEDLFTVERYRQFAAHLADGTRTVLDVGCSTGRGGAELHRLCPEVQLWGLDAVQSRLDSLPPVYARKVRGLSTDLPCEDRSLDAVVAGEFLEHLLPRDVDPTLCEFQRVLAIGGRLLLTTPNPAYLRLRLTGRSVYGPGHLTQHTIRSLCLRLEMHGFARIRVRGSGRMSRKLGQRFPVRSAYGSYLVRADKI